MATRIATIFFTLSLHFLLFLSLSTAQQQQQQPSPAPAPAPAPSSESCNGVFLAYTHTKTTRIPPNLLKTNPTRQPYRFESTLEVLNNGLDELKQWRVFVGFGHGARLNSASNAVLADGEILPAEVGNGTVLAGFPASDLETAVDTAGDLTQMGVRVEFVGVHFGVEPPDVPLPSNISLVNDGFLCTKPTLQGKSRMEVCCTEDQNFKPNTTTLDDEFLPRQSGDLTIMFDVLRTYDSSYWAEVAIANHNPLGRLDFWRLSWDWTKGEFIHTMIGAFPSVVDSSDCIFGPQGQHYRELDFSNVLNCQRRPTIVDLPLSMYNDTKLGLRPYCCRNGTILPPQMDSGRSISKFQMEVFKMPEELNRSRLTPPVNWGVIGTSMNPDYDCGPPVRVSPSEYPDDSGVPVNSTAVASWQVVCNITQLTRDAPKKCCVSFSAYYNDSVIPCGTCACGCGSANQVCSSTAPAMLLPPEALLIPFENRTAKALAWAQLKRSPVPNPLPCGDGCGVSLNWHVVSDYTKGWSARVTVFNWGEESFPDWFASAEMKNAVPGFEKMYSFNGSAIAIGGAINNTLFMEGLPGLNYLVAESDGANPDKDPRVPGKQQTVISFTKKATPGINVPRGDGFPTKVFFNGEECALPAYFPSNGVTRKGGFSTMLVVAFAVFVLIL